MSCKINVIQGRYKGVSGVITGRIPGGRFYKVELDNGTLTALHELEFERIPNNGVLHGENVDDVPVRRKQK